MASGGIPLSNRFEELVKLCIDQAEGLLRFVQELPLSEWSKPSACGEWQVGEVMAHLNHSAHLFSRLIAGMASGVTEGDEAWRVPDPARQQEVADEAKGQRSEIGDAELRHQLLAGTTKFIEVLRALRAEDAEKTSDAAMGGRRTLYQVIGVRVGEIAIHRWDIESRVRAEAPLAPETLPTLMGYLAGWRMFSFQKVRPHAPVHYRWDITEPLTVKWDVVVHGDRFEHVRDARDVPHVTFKTDAETYVLVGVGRLDLRNVIADGRVEVNGSTADIDAYSRYFPSL